MSLRPEQSKAVDVFFKRGGNLQLVAPCGAGKTYVAKGIIERCGNPVLYLCRASAIKEQMDKIDDSRVTFLSHEMFRRKFDELRKTHWKLVICDESHRFLNGTSKGVKMLLKLTAEYRLMMTATPIPNGLKEAYVPLRWLRHPQACWVCWTHFKNAELFENPHVPGMITGVRRPDWLAERLAEVTYNMPTEHQGIEAQVINVILGHEQRMAYDELVRESILGARNGTIIATTPAILNLRLRQFVSHPAVLGHNAPSGKEMALETLLGSITGKCLIFTSFASTARLIAQKHGWPVIEGATSKTERQLILASHPDVLVMTSAGEESIDCEWANVVITYDLPWHNGHLSQQSGRANRLGRIGEVKHYVLMASDTVDEKGTAKIIRKKLNDAKKLYEAGKRLDSQG